MDGSWCGPCQSKHTMGALTLTGYTPPGIKTGLKKKLNPTKKSGRLWAASRKAWGVWPLVLSQGGGEPELLPLVTLPPQLSTPKPSTVFTVSHAPRLQDLRPADNRRSVLLQLQELVRRHAGNLPQLDPIEDMGIMVRGVGGRRDFLPSLELMMASFSASSLTFTLLRGGAGRGADGSCTQNPGP